MDFDETFVSIERLEAIIIFLAYACHKRFKVYQMDFKLAFLNGYLNEEVYMEQQEGFELFEFVICFHCCLMKKLVTSLFCFPFLHPFES
jgi:hypothetical protein